MEVEKESISSVWEESIFSGKGSADVAEKESFGAVVAWETCAVEEEGQEKESVAFWRVVGRGSSSVCREGKSLSGAFEVRERHSGKGNVSAACLPPRSSHGTSWVAHLPKRRRSQNLTTTAGSGVCTGVSAAPSRLQPFCPLYLLPIQIILLF